MASLLEQYIDCCIINGSHYDIALASVEILKGKFRYIGNKNWEYINDANEWILDDKKKNLKYAFKTIVCSAFIRRSIFWEEKSIEDENDVNLFIDDRFRSNKLLMISSKLKDDKYILTIIKECRQLLQ